MKLTPEEIGDNLDLETEGKYPRSDGSTVSTISVDKLLETQLDKVAEWGIEPCFEHTRGGGIFTRRECPKCWKTLVGCLK